MRDKLLQIYNILLKNYGNQKWWPVSSSKQSGHEFEISIGAILTQNTSWKQVEKAIENLKKARLLNTKRIIETEREKIASLIKSTGYYNEKARKLKLFSVFFLTEFEKLRHLKTLEARKKLLCIYGIGKETADSILLYALKKPIFVIDAYTKRLFSRLFNPNNLDLKDYDSWQEFFHENLPRNEKLFNEYHALIVRHSKTKCKKKPLCRQCCLKGICKFPESSF